MKYSIVLLLAGLSIAAASPQFGGFFNNVFGGRGRGRPRGRPQQQSFRNAAPSFRGGRSNAIHNFQGKQYRISWREGQTSFTHSGGASYCRRNGMQPISIDSSAEENEFKRLVAQERQKYFWTGGNVRNGRITWPSGSSYQNVGWSHTGGAGRRQPDNREGNEFCVAVLNNFYQDGVTFHDVSCHHRKPVICEA